MTSASKDQVLLFRLRDIFQDWETLSLPIKCTSFMIISDLMIH